MKKIEVVPINDVKIRSSFAESVPSKAKIDQCLSAWKNHNKYFRKIIVSKNMVLLDGYTQYLAMKQLGVPNIIIEVNGVKNTYRTKPTNYIFGKHVEGTNSNTYIWRIPESWTGFVENIRVDDIVYCYTKYGVKPIRITDIELLSKPPIDAPIQKVSKKVILRYGYEVKMENQIIINILEEFEECKDELKQNVSPQLYYLLLELKDTYKLKGVNFSKNL